MSNPVTICTEDNRIFFTQGNKTLYSVWISYLSDGYFMSIYITSNNGSVWDIIREFPTLSDAIECVRVLLELEKGIAWETVQYE